MMIGGVIWITAGGNASRIGEAKAWIGGALMGLVLALSSYTILYQINAEATKIKPIVYTKVEEIIMGCCAKGEKYLGITTKIECEKKGGEDWKKETVWNGKKCTEASSCCAWGFKNFTAIMNTAQFSTDKTFENCNTGLTKEKCESKASKDQDDDPYSYDYQYLEKGHCSDETAGGGGVLDYKTCRPN